MNWGTGTNTCTLLVLSEQTLTFIKWVTSENLLYSESSAQCSVLTEMGEKQKKREPVNIQVVHLAAQ